MSILSSIINNMKGNLAQSESKKGNDSLYTREFLARHTSNYRLTDRGRLQASYCSEYIKKNLSGECLLYTSKY